MTLKIILRNGAASWPQWSSIRTLYIINIHDPIKNLNLSLAVLNVVATIDIDAFGAYGKIAHIPPRGLGRAMCLVLPSDL